MISCVKSAKHANVLTLKDLAKGWCLWLPFVGVQGLPFVLDIRKGVVLNPQNELYVCLYMYTLHVYNHMNPYTHMYT